MIHFCFFDKDLREFGGPTWRVYIHTRWLQMGIALRPRDKFVGKVGDERTYWTDRHIWRVR